MKEPFKSLFASVCKVQGPSGSGTGFAVHGAIGAMPGLIVTCNHVVENEPSLTVSWWDEAYSQASAQVGPAEILVQDFSRDLALVEVPGLIRTAARISPHALAPGDDFVNVGYPLGSTYPRFVKGIAAGWDFFAAVDVRQRVLVLDGTIHGGQSGGPIAAGDGSVAAVVYATQCVSGAPPGSGRWLQSGIGLAVPLTGLPDMIDSGRNMKYRVVRGTAAERVSVDRRALAQLQHWLLSEVESPVAELSCNFRHEVWVRPSRNARGPMVPVELRAGVAPIVAAYLRKRRSGGRFMFNGRTAFAFDPDDGAYTPLVELVSEAPSGEVWSSTR